MLDRLFGGLPETGGGLPSIARAEPFRRDDRDRPGHSAVGGRLRERRHLARRSGFHAGPGDGLHPRRRQLQLAADPGDAREARPHLRHLHLSRWPRETTAASTWASFSSSNQHVSRRRWMSSAQEWDRMANDGVTDAELVSAKRFLTGDYALRFEGNASIAAQLIGVQVAGLGLDFINMRNDLVEAVTADDVARVARRLLSSGVAYDRRRRSPRQHGRTELKGAPAGSAIPGGSGLEPAPEAGSAAVAEGFHPAAVEPVVLLGPGADAGGEAVGGGLGHRLGGGARRAAARTRWRRAGRPAGGCRRPGSSARRS